MSAPRPLRPEDGPELMAMAREFGEESPVSNGVPFDDQKLLDLFGRSLSDPDLVFCQVADAPEGGLAGGVLAIRQQYFFSQAWHCVELTVFVRPEYRQTRIAVKLLKAMEQWAESTGCLEINIGATAGVDSPAYQRLLERFGYQTVGFVAKKQLGG